MKNILPFLYLIVLAILLIISAIMTFIIDGPLFFIFDTAISTLILIGVFLFIKNRLLPMWKVIFLFCLVWEVYFIITANNLELYDMVYWFCVLIPAFYMNAKIAGITIKFSGPNGRAVD